MFEPQHVADAYRHVARVNHYLVTVNAANICDDELSAAQQLLIDIEHREPDVVGLALDLIEAEQKRRLTT